MMVAVIGILLLQHPTQDGGAGYTLTGHHAMMLPLLYAMLLETLESEEANAPGQ